MKTLRMRHTSRVLVLVFALCSLVMGIPVAAHAIGVDEPPTIDDTQQGVLHIHKYTTPVGIEGTGLEKTDMPADNKPVEGVKFSIKRVSNIDITTNEGLVEAGKVSAAFKNGTAIADLTLSNGQKLTFDTPVENTTDTAGQADYTGLPLGLYLVTETDVKGAKINGSPAQVVPSKPFFVSIPITHPTDRDNWLYEVHVYPKNSEFAVTKTVDDSTALVAGQDLTYEITSDIPKPTGSDPAPSRFVVIDKLSPALQYKNVAVKISTQTSSLVAGTDYNVTHDAATNTVTVEMTPGGRTKLGQAVKDNPDAKVVVNLTATVKPIGDANGANAGVIANTAYVAPSTDFSTDPNDPNNPPISSNEVESHFAKLKVVKSGDGGEKLAGAEFELYKCNEQGDIQGAPLSVAGKSTFTTAANGEVVIDAVRVLDWNNGKKVDSHNERYCLQETQAPQGYSLLAKPIIVDVTSDKVTDGVFAVEVTNVKHNLGFDLPLTGSKALVIMLVAGGLLLAGALVTSYRRKDRN